MKSKWYEFKPVARELRKKGLSIGNIEHRLKIPRSTLSGWLKDIKLTPRQRKKLLVNWKQGLVKARRKAVLWHHAQKEKRLEEAKNKAFKTLAEIDIENKEVLELALAILYMGEGTKKKVETSIGSSNPLILKFFLALLKKLYKLDSSKIKCQL
ncbi:MAG: hypothetical protein Q8N65_01045, partial [bacterium]|nr:hypothetical protein [bacterium]